MSMLAFFPWLKINDNFIMNDLKFHKFKIDHENSRDTFNHQCEKVLSHYYFHSNNPIDECTLVFLEGKQNFNDFSENEIELLFSFADILAFSGLSKREYFGLGFRYWNRDSFNLVIQGFEESANGVTKVSQRRDGQTKSYFSGDTFKEIMPYHVNNVEALIDIPLIESILNFQTDLG